MLIDPNRLNYVDLLAAGRRQPPPEDVALRIALLGYCTTAYYAQAIRGTARQLRLPTATWEAPYDTVEQTALDPGSGLRAFKPDAVVVVTAVQSIRDRLISIRPHDRSAAADAEAARFISVIRQLSNLTGSPIIFHRLVGPYERPWGNYTRSVAHSIPHLVDNINAAIDEAAAGIPNAFTLDCDHIASLTGKKHWFDERLWFLSKSFCHPSVLPDVSKQLLDIVLATRGKVRKCLALDLDNTLWGGVIGDDGLQGIRVGSPGGGEAFARFQAWLKEMSTRGILLAVCSKNDEERAREPFKRHSGMVLHEDDIACFVANWHDKAQNLRFISTRLNIGLDSIVFLDDSPFERELVRSILPEVQVPDMPADPADFVPFLESLNLFETLAHSAEDMERTHLYHANEVREKSQAAFSDIGEYLVSLEMRAQFAPFDDSHMLRIAQLVQRTNQFNLTTIRHTERELRSFADDPGYRSFYVRLSDRFGDNGLVSVLICRREESRLEIVTWVMSCRVFARRLEEFIIDRLVETARQAGVVTIVGRYEATSKNSVVADLYGRLGFIEDRDSANWAMEVSRHRPFNAPIENDT